MEEKVKSTLAISYQNNYKAKDLDDNINADKAEDNENELAWAENQYPTPDPLVLESFLANLVSLLVKNTSFFESEGMDYSHKKLFSATIAKKKPKYCLLEPAVITELE